MTIPVNIIIGFIIGCQVISVYGSLDPQIVGGSFAPIGAFPYQASIRFSQNDQHFCGGIIIHKNHILTAAHCLNDIRNPSEIYIAVGSNSLYPRGTVYQVENFTLHEDYSKLLHFNDIALIKISKDFNFTKTVVQPIELPKSDRDFDNVSLLASGWGRLEANGRIPNDLVMIQLKGYSQKKCYEHFLGTTARIMNSHICTFNMKGEGMCNGDSGGPLVQSVLNNTVLIGIVSFGMSPCANGNPDVFTRVFYFKSWINTIIGNTGYTHQSNIILSFLMAYLCIQRYLFL